MSVGASNRLERSSSPSSVTVKLSESSDSTSLVKFLRIMRPW